MNRLKTDQKNKVKQFAQFTGQNEAVGIHCLTVNNWSLERACDAFFQDPRLYQQMGAQGNSSSGSGSGSSSSSASTALDQFFNRYRDSKDSSLGDNVLGPHGIVRLLDDLGFPHDDRRVLLLAHKLNAKTQCEFTREEWTTGLQEMGVTTLDQLRTLLTRLNTELSQSANSFKEMYNWTFNYAKPVAQRNLAMDMAIAYWKILFQREYALLDLWFEFLKAEHVKPIPKDTWQLFFDFARNIHHDFSNYDADGAWPVLIDTFVEFVKRRRVDDQQQEMAAAPA